MRLIYYIGDKAVSAEEFTKEYLRRIKLEDMYIEMPRDQYYAVEYGEPLPENQKTFLLIRECLQKECNFKGKDLDEQAKKQYGEYTRKHVPRPFIHSVLDALHDTTQDEMKQGLLKKKMIAALKSRLKEYNTSGICTLGLADKIKFISQKDGTYDEDEHEAV